MTLKLAFTGSGYIGKIHAQAAQKLADVSITAIVNQHPASRQAFAAQFAVPRQYTKVAELLQAGDVDAISINTPNYLHAPQAIAALQAGVHVMVEKTNGHECFRSAGDDGRQPKIRRAADGRSLLAL